MSSFGSGSGNRGKEFKDENEELGEKFLCTVNVSETTSMSASKKEHLEFYGDGHLGKDLHLLDLPWEQVLSFRILSYLSIPDLFHLRAVSHECRSLVQTHFSLQFTVNTSLLGDRFTSEAFRIMTCDCVSLKSLMLRGAKSWLTNDVLLDVIASNPRLETIDLSGCISLSGPALYSIGVNCSNIRYLSVKDCVWLSVDNFLSFLCNQRDLEYLDLSGCWNLDDDSLIVQLVRVSPNLKHLLLSKLYGLTDRSVVAIAHCCPNLIHLSIRSCWRVTDNSIKLLSQYCPKLRAIQVQDCRNITEESLGPLRARKVRIDKAGPPQSMLRKLEQQMNVPHKINLAL